MIHIKRFGQLFEAESEEKKYGCAMVSFDVPLMELFHSVIDEEDLDPEKGLETECHCTLLYGLHEEVMPNEVLDKIEFVPKGVITLGPVSMFENEKFDVLKFDADAEWLHAANADLTNMPHTNKFPDYHPHCTIAYLKPGCGQKYVDMFKGLTYEVQPKDLIYSSADRTKTKRTIDGN